MQHMTVQSSMTQEPHSLEFLDDFDSLEEGGVYLMRIVRQNKITEESDSEDEEPSEEEIDEDEEWDYLVRKGRRITRILIGSWMLLCLLTRTRAPFMVAFIIAAGAIFFMFPNTPILQAGNDPSHALTPPREFTAENRLQPDPHPRTPKNADYSQQGWFQTLVDLNISSHLLRKLAASARFIALVLLRYLCLQAGVQFLITLTQAKNITSLFPQYCADIKSNISSEGFAAQISSFKFVINWYCGWIYGLTAFLLWHLPKCLLQSIMQAVNAEKVEEN
ncbi:hypothetical protein GQ44DRAFT_729765 [Phaeosphaeriaceae sp. PMI808]|nr:hypothetical protein GQ44DRAFT_729765 [Phaeosphaeriaceae sp. PMI808]